jgi:predicted patatin/cPLA2 family phospholipase
MIRLCKRKYADYPQLISALENRYIIYNKTMDYIYELDKNGDIFVMRPTLPPVSRFEKSVEKLNDFYIHGYEDGKKHYTPLLKYIK